MDENTPDSKGGTTPCKEAGKEAEAGQVKLPRLDMLKKSPVQQRRGSLGATPSEGHKEWFEKLLRANREGKTGANTTNETTTIDLTQAWLGEKKRAREEESFIIEQNSTKRDKREKTTNSEMDQTIKTMCEQITRVGKMIAEAHNPKRELKETVQRLVQQTENLKKLKASVEDRENEQTGNILEENESLKAKLEKMERRLEELERERTRRDRPETLNLLEELGNQDYNTWKYIADRKWDTKLFTNVGIKIGSPLETDSNVVKVVIVEPDDLQMEKSIQQMFKARFPELKYLEAPFDLLEVTTRTKRLTTTQEVVKITWDGIEEHLYEQLTALRQETGNKKEIAIHHVRAIGTDRLRKMMQAIFQEGPKLTIFTTKSREIAEKENTMAREVKRANKEQKSYAIVVSKTEGDTKETISKIKKGIQGMASNRAIQQIKTGKEGKIIISLDKDEQAMNILSKAIENTIGQGSVKLQGKKENQEIFYIRGLDQSATVEEVMEALEERVGQMEKGEISLSPLRPFGRGNQAVTVYISEKHVRNLTTANEIRIGLVRCRLERHIELARCNKCWAFDHKSAQCNGEDRRANCYRCGQSGHTAKNCQNDENCLMCKEGGHSASSGRCKIYKAAINSVRRQHQVQIINGQ